MDPSAGPLTHAELSELESTLLPALERHHLRLLAHSLRTLQGIAAREHGRPPSREALEHWASDLPALRDDPDFREGFLDQLEAAGRQLENVASLHHTSALALELDQLVAWVRGQADLRVGNATTPG